MYKIELARKAARFYQRADTVTARRLNQAFSRLAEDPFGHYSIKRLRGEFEGSYRLRVGEIRIVYSVDETKKIVYVEVIGYRGNVYRR
jgi:mRNA interferase RelE/StbE